MSRSKIFFSAVLLVMLVGPGTVMAAETQNDKAGAADQTGEKVLECQKKIGMSGRPHRISSIASLGAVRAWSQRALKHGKEYAMWHNADTKSLKCEKKPNSDYYVCFASGKPCPATSEDKTASNKTN